MICRQKNARFTAARAAHVGALACAVAALSCADAPPAEPLVLAGERAAEAAGDDAFGERFKPSIEFAPCTDDPAFECGTLRVPADYDQPGGEKIGLAALRAKATGDRIGSLFVNFGGPGGNDVDFLKFVADSRLAPLRERFDLVTFDPRGTGRSEPAVRCDFEAPPAPAPGDSAERAAYLDEHARRFAEACLAQTGPVVTRLGTNNVARDIDLFRAALGEKAISFHGASYGAELGAVYASLFPKRVRAMVLDGGTSDTFADYTVEAFVEQAAASELALERVGRLCASDLACPLHDAGLVAGLDQVMATLRESPVTSPDGTLVLGEREAGIVVYIQLLSERNRWGRLPAFVAAALAGDYEAWFNFVLPPEPGGGLDAFSQVYAAILCNDFGSRRPAAEFLPVLEAAEGLYPRVGKFVEFDVLLRTCQAWPAADPPTFRNVADKVKAPILLVGNNFDAATPINWTRHLARALGMEDSFLLYEGGGHTATSLALRGVPCVDQLAYRYLFDLEVPPAGASCPALPVTFAPSL